MEIFRTKSIRGGVKGSPIRMFLKFLTEFKNEIRTENDF